MTRQGPRDLANGLEGVVDGAEAALTDDELRAIRKAIEFLRSDARRRDGIREKIDRAANGGDTA